MKQRFKKWGILVMTLLIIASYATITIPGHTMMNDDRSEWSTSGPGMIQRELH